MSDKTALDTKQLIQQLALSQSQQQAEDEIDLAELWRAIWAGKWLIIAVTSIFTVASVAYALSLPNIYKSEALLAPASQEEGGMGALASQFGGLASLAGVSLGGSGGIDKTALALEIMKSREFISAFINDNQLHVPLMAANDWSRDDNNLLYDQDIYDAKADKWVRKVKLPKRPMPSSQEATKRFLEIFSISQDKTSSMILLNVEHYSPFIAKQWVDLLTDAINAEMKKRDLSEAQRSIAYLEEQLKKTRVSGLQDVLYQLVEEQTKTIMFASVREQYAFKTIDSAIVPEIKAGPKRALICILGILLGGMLAIMVVLISHLSKKSNDNE